MADFSKFSKLIESKFDLMKTNELYKVDISKDDLWELYLGAFPEGTDPIYRVRTEHDCSCCRTFVKNVANVVSIQDGQIVTVWDVEDAEYPYNVVAEKMAELVRSAEIINVFRTSENHFSSQTTRELAEDGSVINWNHFHCTVPAKHQSNEVGSVLGSFATSAAVFKRGLEELRITDVDAVIDLVNDNLLYRGAEHLVSLKAFRALKAAYDKINSAEQRNLFVWENIGNHAKGFRNTVIGSLVQDLSAGVDIENAVGSFEAKVAPENYKRSKSLITPAMIKDAMKTIKSEGFESALERRFAKIDDVSVNNVLFVDNSVQEQMKDGIEGLLMDAAVTRPKLSKNVEEIDIDSFMTNVVPQANSIELLLKNSLQSNFVSLTAPVHADSKPLHKWNNEFAWSYNGNITDSIKQKVKRAGGKVDGAIMRVSLAWYNTDDLDIHIHEPDGNHVFYGARDGKLDVDMNVSNPVRDAVENVSWTRKMQDGVYKVKVNNFTRRSDADVGFVIETENNGVVNTYAYESAVSGTVDVISIVVKNNTITEIIPNNNVVEGMSSQESWNVKTEEFVPVNVVLNSPNHWDDNKTGNKHWFFILKDCKNPEPTRGIYNEFMNSNLDKHRKVFEILGDKTKCQVVDDQLSGVGFSSTKHDTVTVAVKGDKLQKTYKVTF